LFPPPTSSISLNESFSNSTPISSSSVSTCTPIFLFPNESITITKLGGIKAKKCLDMGKIKKKNLIYYFIFILYITDHKEEECNESDDCKELKDQVESKSFFEKSKQTKKTFCIYLYKSTYI